jgi:large subunit ribosomal protein L2
MKNKGISSFIGNLEVGSIVHNIESAPGKGITLLRAAGNSGVLVHKSSKFGVIKLSSGILQKVSLTCVGVRNMVSNSVHRFLSIKKAGSARLLGRRPTVRGVAMNPVDHPHGGGEGKKSQLALPKTP